MTPDFAKFVDQLNKLQAKGGLPSGGSQYTMEVALGPMASAKGQALMRAKKTKPQKPLSLHDLMKQQMKQQKK